MNFLLIFFTSLIFTIFFTPYFIAYLQKTKVVDLPGNRRIHTAIVPRMGGLLIFMVVSVMMLTFFDNLNSIRLIIISANIILMIGIFDDILGLDYSAKFLLQIFSTVLLIFYLSPKFSTLSLFGLDIPAPFHYILLGIFILGSINSVNLLDGMDGLVSGFSLLIFSIILALAIISNDTFLLILSTSLMGGILGFLKYNAHPAKIFLGDTGSLTLGYFLVLTSILTSINYNNHSLDLTFPIMLLAIPIIDTIKVMSFRIIRKQNPFLPDKTHIHHIITSNNISHKFTVFLIESFTLIFIIIALYYVKVSHMVPTILFFVFVGIVFLIDPILKFIRKYSKWNSKGEVIREVPAKVVGNMENFLVSLSTILIAVIIILSIPQSSNISINLLFLFFAMGLILFLLAYGHQKRSKDISNIYTFINLAAFFTITNLNSSSIFNITTSDFNVNQMTEISYYILAVIIVLFLISSDKISPVRRVVLNGIDLTVIAFIMLIMIINSFIKFHFDEFFSISFLEAFIFYLWYKIMISIKTEMTNLLFYGSFALPFLAIITLIIM